jgi:uncharacterized protein YecE (DUF72 family)
MATRLHIGAPSRNLSFASYAKRFDLMEVESGVPRAPSAATLRKWRKAVPPHFDFCVVAGPALAKVKAGEALEGELAAARDAIAALQARCFLLPTPSEVTPGALWRDRIARVIDRLPRDATHVVWEPRGVWETDDAAVAARRWGVVLAVDAARDPVPEGPVAYVRLRALGETRSFGASALERVVSAIGLRREAFVVLDTPAAAREAKELRRLARDVPAGRAGAGARVLRPRGSSVRVRDDEQE